MILYVVAACLFGLSVFVLLFLVYRVRRARTTKEALQQRIDQLAYEKYRVYSRLDSVNVALAGKKAALANAKRELGRLAREDAQNVELQGKIKKKNLLEKNLHRTVAAVAAGEEDVMEISLSHELGSALMPEFPFPDSFSVSLDRCEVNFRFNQGKLYLASIRLDERVELPQRDQVSLALVSARTSETLFKAKIPVYSFSSIDMEIAKIDQFLTPSRGAVLSGLRRKLETETAAWDEAVERESESLFAAADEVRFDIYSLKSEISKLKNEMAPETEPVSPPLLEFPLLAVDKEDSEAEIPGSTGFFQSEETPKAETIWSDDVVTVKAARQVSDRHVDLEIFIFPKSGNIESIRTEVVNKDVDACVLKVNALAEVKGVLIQAVHLDVLDVFTSEINFVCEFDIAELSKHLIDCVLPVHVTDLIRQVNSNKTQFEKLWLQCEDQVARMEISSVDPFALRTAITLHDKLWLAGSDSGAELRAVGELSLRKTGGPVLIQVENEMTVEVRSFDAALSRAVLERFNTILSKYSRLLIS